ncbi:maleylpyruvate isomerase family mycothiol-dependent enzyme [Chloroflexota bacterium]
MLQVPLPAIVVDLFPEILDRLLRLLDTLTEQEWNTPTACAGWSVKDVAVHLLGVEVSNLSRRRDRYSSGVSVDGWDELVAFINDWNQQWVQVGRRISSPLLIDLLGSTGGQMCEYVRTLDPYAMDGPVSWAGPGPAPVWLDIAREYTERWHHQQHIRDAVVRPGLKEPKYLAPVLAAFARAMPRAFQGASSSEGTVVTLTVMGGSGGQWSLRQEGEVWRFYGGTVPQPKAEVQLDGETAWRFFTRGISQDQVREKMTLVGDRALGLRVLEMVSIIA